MDDRSDVEALIAAVKGLTDYLYCEASRDRIRNYCSHFLPSDIASKVFEPPCRLSSDAKQQLKNSRNEEDDKVSNKVSKLIVDFIVRDKDARIQALQSDSGIGMLFFSAACGISPPVHELELDCRGSVEKLGDDLYRASVGEIKSSSKGAAAASRQLQFKLAVLETAIKCFYGNGAEVKKLGLIYLPATQARHDNPPVVDGMTVELVYI